MSRVREYLQLIDDPRQPPLDGSHPADGPLQDLLVQLAFSDGVVQGDEWALLKRIRSDLDENGLLEWASGRAERPFDASHLAAVLPGERERYDCLRFAARMVCLDGEVTEEEIGALHQLAQSLGLPRESAVAVVQEIVAKGGEVDQGHLAAALRHMLWDVLTPTREELASDLASVVPEDAEPVCAVLLDDREVAGLFYDGLAARFDDGARFVAWREIVAYTRVPVPGAAFHLRTVRGEQLSLSDPRLRDVGALLDLVYGRVPLPRP